MRVQSIILFIALCVGLKAQLQPPVFAIRSWQRDYLRYNTYHNGFDSCGVSVRFGEFAISSSSSWVPLSLRRVMASYTYQGDSVQGRDEKLAALSYTSVFTVPDSGGTLHWMRDFYCTSKRMSQSMNRIGPNVPEFYSEWPVGVGQMPDRSEFLVELCDDRATVIACIDSFGVMQHPNSPLATRYGTAPDTMLRNYMIPASLAGRRLYCRIVPVRYGPTPLGMQMWQTDDVETCNTTAFLVRNGSTFTSASTERQQEIDSLFCEEVTPFLDSIFKVYGTIPFEVRKLHVPSCCRETLIRKYFKERIETSSNTPHQSAESHDPLEEVRITRVQQDAFGTRPLVVELFSPHNDSIQVFITLRDRKGKELSNSVREVWIRKANNRFTLETLTLEPGIYYLAISRPDQSFSMMRECEITK